MACGDTGDINVFSSRLGGFSVGGDNVPPTHNHCQQQAPETSLLTFADMVLALDSKIHNVDNEGKQNSQFDHNYASNKSKMTTRSQSQALRINEIQDPDHSNFKHPEIEQTSLKSKDSQESFPKLEQMSPKKSSNLHKKEKGCNLKAKRSSSAENITTECDATDTNTFKEWPQIPLKNSPRKSCSFEEVNKPSGAHKPDVRYKGGSSGQLHRLVNDTVEFPCWPRKADHTYATATWDGTAASQGIFEYEVNKNKLENNIHSNANSSQSQVKMDCITEAIMVPITFTTLHSNLFAFSDFKPHSTPCQLETLRKKNDHTYVKHKLNSLPSSSTTSTTSTSNPKLIVMGSEFLQPSSFSGSTFPRQKPREDHTYFSSGTIKHNTSSSSSSSTSGPFEGNNAQTTSNPTRLQNKDKIKKEFALSTAQLNPQLFVSSKKDHNYFSSGAV